jgi:hypothetical protein
MALSAIRNNICQKLDNSFTGFLGIVSSAYTAVSGSINSIKTMIKGMQYSAINILQQAATQVDSGLNNAIPDIQSDELTEMINIINSCPFLKDDKTLGNPLTLIRTLNSSMRADAQSVFNALTSSLAEFNVAKLMYALFVIYSDEFKFEDIIPNMYEIIDCIDALCPNTDISSKIITFGNYVDKLYLLTDGTFDKVTFFNELSLNVEKSAKIDIGLTSYKNMRDRINDSITNGVDLVKSLL